MKKKLFALLAIVLVVSIMLSGCVLYDTQADALAETENWYLPLNSYAYNGTSWVRLPGAGGGGGAGLWETDGGDAELIIPDSIDMQSQFIHNVLDPVLNQDAATKSYVDTADTILANADTVLTNDLASNVTQLTGNITDLQDDLATNATAITTNAAAIAVNVGNIAANTANIATNTADIASNVSAIAANAAGVATNAADIASNVSMINTNTANIATNTADIASNVSAITTNAADIASNATVIATNTANIATNTADIASNATQIATNTADISSNATLLDNHINDIEAHHAMAGSTFPASPVDGMRFVHNVTGRKIFYIYDLDNAVWVAVQSVGAMTLYVDKTDGTDDSSHGTGVDGDAFATVQYAVDCIPPVFTGNVVINITGEDYGEDVVLQGKSSSGAYSITLQGTLSEVASGTQSANGVQGTGADQGQFIDAGNLAGYENYLCYLDADGDYRVIDWSDANSANATGTFTSQPLNGENYKIYDWATVLNSVQILSPMLVYLYDIEIDGTGATSKAVETVGSTAIVNMYRCNLEITGDAINVEGATMNIYNTHIQASHWGLISRTAGHLIAYRTKIEANGDTAIGLEVNNIGWAQLTEGCVIDGTAGVNKASYGVRVRSNSIGTLYAPAATGYDFVRDCDTGVYATEGGQVAPYSTVYSGNTADETPDPASYGYIG